MIIFFNIVHHINLNAFLSRVPMPVFLKMMSEKVVESISAITDCG